MNGDKHYSPSRLSFYLLVAASVMIYFDPLIRFTEENLFVSDLLIVLSAASLVMKLADIEQFVRAVHHNPFATPFLLFAAAAIASLGIGMNIKSVQPIKTILALMQLGFIFLFLAPLVFLHSQILSRLRALWILHGVMIAFAGLLSVTDYYEITHFVEQTFHRYANPLLGVNGFWLFGLIAPFLLHSVIRSFLHRSLLVGISGAVIWALGFSGVVLTGVRTGLVITVLSFAWVLWFYRPITVRDWTIAVRVRNLGVVIVAGAFICLPSLFIALEFPVLEARATVEMAAAASTLVKRWEAIEVALSEIEKGAFLFGLGLHQFTSIHPELDDTIHNVYLQALYETGLVGLIALGWLFYRAWRQVKHWSYQARLRSDSGNFAHWNASLFAIAGTVLAGLIYPIGFSRPDWMFFLLAAGPIAIHPSHKSASYRPIGLA